MDALALLRKHESILKKRFGVAKIGIFGHLSAERSGRKATWMCSLHSGKGEETFDHYMDCKFYLEDLFGRNVDLVMKGAIKPRLREYILGEVVYA